MGSNGQGNYERLSEAGLLSRNERDRLPLRFFLAVSAQSSRAAGGGHDALHIQGQPGIFIPKKIAARLLRGDKHERHVMGCREIYKGSDCPKTAVAENMIL